MNAPVPLPKPQPTTMDARAVELELFPQEVSSKKRFTRVAALSALILAAAFVAGYLPKRQRQAGLLAASEAMRHAHLRIEAISPKLVASDRALVLPGSVQPLQETVLYPRASGYVRNWLVDIGDKVKAGQLLAVIETPEVEQQLSEARAQLKQTQASLVQAKANRGLAKANLARYQALAPSGVVSQADLEQNEAQADVAEANVDVAEANVAAQQANIRRLTQLTEFAKVTAPFAGTVTQRWIEIGSLVTAGNTQPLFKVAALDPARVFIQVPQDVAPSLRAGVDTQVSVREYPGRVFHGKVSRAADELDASTRTMNTEIRVPNHDGALIAGMYAEVSLTLPSPHRVLQLPSTALMNDASGERVAVIDATNHLHLVKVVIERDEGASVAISSGLEGDERVAKIGSAAFTEGATVEILEPAAAPAH